VRLLGIDQGRMKAETGVVFAVRRIEADYLRPARFDDLLEVRTRVAGVTPARITLAQDVLRGDDRLFAARVELVALGANGRPVRLPRAFAGLSPPGADRPGS
jgi:acyl-CoA thioester hydrolase